MPFEAPLNMRQLAQAKFANTFISDSRSPQVALSLMQDLFAQQNYVPAQDWARWLLHQHDNSQSDMRAKNARGNATQSVTNNSTSSLSNIARSPVSSSMQESAKLVIAHSYFAMDAFAKAELSYRDLLSTLAINDERRANVNDRLAASLYKQAEALLLANRVDTGTLQQQNITNKSQLMPMQISALEKGVALLQQVVTQTPLSEFRQAAQYDSAVYFSLLENWPSAIATFLDFQARYPQSSLTPGISNQLFYAYEQSQDFAQAALILLAEHEAAPNTEKGRLALLQAAEYFQKAQDRDNALNSFRRYAHQYPQPMSDANEARFTLSEFYLQSDEASKRRFWLNKLVQAHQAAIKQQPSLGTPRSVYLASFAAMVFATDANTVFTRIKLTQPLATSLQNKQAALQNAIDQYERIIGFGSAQFVTAANYELANLYIVLAQDLMTSSRPKGLSPLELSQYEILLEEQVYPFEETAIGLHEKNIARTRTGLYDEWVKRSFTALKNNMPGRYNKPEVTRELTLDDL
jgi:TolA-binding protein